LTLHLSLKRQSRYAPRGPRIAVDLGTSLVLADDRVVPVTIHNLSSNGFMAKCRGKVPENAWLGVELPGCGILRARVRWIEDGEIGCQLRKAIDLDQFSHFGAPPSEVPSLFR
jgi:hypothetical protein